MALNAAITWEVRTTGASTNGGGFKTGATGTDYSQQDAAQWALTGIATAGAGSTFLYASADAAMVGNVCKVVSGTNMVTGFFEITSVSAGVSVTVDRAVCTGISADAVINIGGAVDHPNTISASVVAGNTVFVAPGTYVKVGANAYVLTLSVSGGNGTPILWKGYITNHSTIPTGTDRPVFDGATNTTNVLVGGTTVANSFYNLIMKRASGTNVSNSNNGLWSFSNVRITQAGTDGTEGDFDSTYINCEIDANGSSGRDAGSSGTMVLISCYVHDNAAHGIFGDDTGMSLVVINSISESNSAGHGFACTGSKLQAFNSIAYNNAGASSAGFRWNFASTAANQNFVFLNNISVSNGQYGFNRTGTGAPPPAEFNYNSYYGNGTAGLNNITAGPNDVTTNPTFTDAANGDFSLQAGSPCIDTGFPGHSMAGATV